MLIPKSFYFRITSSKDELKFKRFYFIKKESNTRLYILDIADDGSAGLINSDHQCDNVIYEFLDNVEEVVRGDLAKEGAYEIGEEEFMQHVDELFPRWRELKFDKKAKKLYLPEEEEISS